MCASDVMTNNAATRRWTRFGVPAMLMVAALVPNLRAADPENCMLCHRYRGLARVDENEDRIHLYYVDPDYTDRGLGPHARLKCTDCHLRSEVEVIPHKPTSPVNCTATCHLDQPGNIELTFSHESVHATLESSAHTAETLAKSNELLGMPLHADQSQCLLCHDEPTYAREDQTWRERVAPVQRCDACHQGQLDLDTQFAFWHVESRSRPAWSHENMARVCAVCHSHEEIRASFEMPDTVASYLASFHGKAVLLGSEDTADCLDCHINEWDNAHRILSKTEEPSSTHPEQVSDTCRSADCHPTADVGISTAAVHLDLATSRGIEFIIGAIFILLILGTFGPSVVLQSLEMLQIVIGRHDPRQHRREELTRKLMATHEGRRALSRFTPHQRVQHWLLVLSFTALVVTGFPIKFADKAWAAWLVDMKGGLPSARNLHRYAGVVLIVGFVYHLLYVAWSAWMTQRRTKQGWLKTFLDLPMMSNPREIKELFQQIAFLLFLRKERPDGDRFTLKEKFEYFGVFWGSVLLGITGMLMWYNAWTTEHLTGRVLTIALIVHSFEAFLALLHVGVIHMIGVILSPLSFPMSPAMFTGDTPVEEMAEAHAGMVERAAAEHLPDQKAGEHHD